MFIKPMNQATETFPLFILTSALSPNYNSNCVCQAFYFEHQDFNVKPT